MIFGRSRSFLVPATLLIGFLVIGILALTQPASALPPAGGDTFNVDADVSVVSRLGEETIPLTGTFGVVRSDPVIDEETGVEVVSIEVVAIDLEGESVTGPVEVFLNEDFTSTGELRSLQPPPDDFPADSHFDIFVEAGIPISGSRSSPTIHNETALHLVPIGGPIGEWPPTGVTYEADITGCLPLFPILPAEICVDAATFTVGGTKVSTPTDTPCPPDICTPTPTPTNTPTATSTATATAPPPPPPPALNPTFSTGPGGPSGAHPADLLGLGQSTTQPSGNDNFANAFVISSFPFVGVQNTSGSTTEPGEDLNPDGCLIFQPNKIGATVWYRFVAPVSTTLIASTAGSSYDTTLALFTGASVSTTTSLACNDDAPGQGLQSEISAPISQGTTYYLQVGGWHPSSGAPSSGELVLIVDFAGGAGGGMPGFISCSALGLSAAGCTSSAPQDDINALSFGSDFQESTYALAFSVAPGSAGLGTSGVAQQAGCSPAQPQADIFSTAATGSNALLFDGDGLTDGCPTASSLGLIEVPTSDNVDALNGQPPSFVDPLGTGSLNSRVFFSLAPGSPSLGTLNRTPADILWTLGGTPGLYASASALGLRAGDDIDAVCIRDVGPGTTFSAASDTVLFSLAPGSPTLSNLGASAADVLAPGPRVHIRASDMGLRVADNLNAMACYEDATPDVVPGDANCDGQINAIDAAVMLQFIAGLLGTIPCAENADVNGDGQTNAIDVALVLQFVAGLVSQLPP